MVIVLLWHSIFLVVFSCIFKMHFAVPITKIRVFRQAAQKPIYRVLSPLCQNNLLDQGLDHVYRMKILNVVLQISNSSQ